MSAAELKAKGVHSPRAGELSRGEFFWRPVVLVRDVRSGRGGAVIRMPPSHHDQQLVNYMSDDQTAFHVDYGK